MKIDVAGRVRNVVLPKSRALLPLYEAITNSIQAIEDAGERDGKITIKFTREPVPQLLDTDSSIGDIASFEVVDNGVGFNQENFEAFQTSDTTYKAKRGGKGIGRFLWLVAFDSVEIRSTFLDAKAWKTRAFKFISDGHGIADNSVSEASESARLTSVRLQGFKRKFREVAPKKIETIGTHIVEHCLEYLIRPGPPQIELIDETNSGRVDLNEIYEQEMNVTAKRVEYKQDGVTFTILHVRRYSPHIEDHIVHFCANGRVVKSEKVAGRIPNLAKRLVDEGGREFVYAAYVDSALLDTAVNEERTDFNLSSDDGGLFPESMAWAQVRDAAVGQARAYLLPYTESIRQEKGKRIEQFVATEAPMYRPILKYVEEEVGMIDPDISDEKLDLELYRAYSGLQLKLRAEGQELMESQKDTNSDFERFASEFDDYLARISEVNQADLARYVFHRRLALDFLQKLLGRGPDGKHALEDRVHHLIFPMRKTSEDVMFDQHNLWMLDERLSYHQFLASDKPLRSVAPLANDSSAEPDIIVFDKACAFASPSDEPFQTITIIEFKRPMRKDYSEDENPFGQVLDYVDQIQKGKARTADGRDVPVAEGVHFYCYIVADKTEKIEALAYKASLEKTPDNQGFFGYNKKFRAYIEFISYTKLLTDARQRNRAFIERLGLPSCLPASPKK